MHSCLYLPWWHTVDMCSTCWSNMVSHNGHVLHFAGVTWWHTVDMCSTCWCNMVSHNGHVLHFAGVTWWHTVAIVFSTCCDIIHTYCKAYKDWKLRLTGPDLCKDIDFFPIAELTCIRIGALRSCSCITLPTLTIHNKCHGSSIVWSQEVLLEQTLALFLGPPTYTLGGLGARLNVSYRTLSHTHLEGLVPDLTWAIEPSHIHTWRAWCPT